MRRGEDIGPVSCRYRVDIGVGIGQISVSPLKLSPEKAKVIAHLSINIANFIEDAKSRFCTSFSVSLRLSWRYRPTITLSDKCHDRVFFAIKLTIRPLDNFCDKRILPKSYRQTLPSFYRGRYRSFIVKYRRYRYRILIAKISVRFDFGLFSLCDNL